MMDTLNTSLCSHQPLDNHNHVFRMVEGTRDSINVMAYYIEQLQLANKWYGKGHICLLVDARSAAGLPIRYLFEVLSDYNRPYPDLEPPRLTLAYLRSPDAVILDIYHMMAELFEPPITVQFFIDEERAKRWLLETR